MQNFVKVALAAASVAALPFASAIAAPAAPGLSAPATVQQVQYREGRGSGYYDAPAYNSQRGYRGGDNVGSIVRDGRNPYGYNQFSGQRYQECMLDEGYGRVRPCSQSGRP